MIAVLGSACLLAACAGDSADGKATAQGADTLPRPGSSSGSVTGMPDPGAVNPAPPAEGAFPDAMPAPSNAAGPDTATLEQPKTSDANVDDAQSVAQAQAVLRDYYAAINAGDPALAYTLWADQGRASGQSLQSFVESFAPTDGVSVQLGIGRTLPGLRAERLVEIPATVDGPGADGSMRRHAGTYTLRADPPDASATAQRWQIVSADLREIRP